MATLEEVEAQIAAATAAAELTAAADAVTADLSAAADLTATVKTPSVTKPSETAIQYADALSNATRIDTAPPDESVAVAENARLLRSGRDYSNESPAENARLLRAGIDYSNESPAENARLSRLPVSPGAEPKKRSPSSASFYSKEDFRPRLVIPSFYLGSPYTTGPRDVIKNSGGIVFPYTPTISQDYRATYANAAPVHSNYSLNFYKNSSPGEISLTAKLTVQNDMDAHFYLSVVHLLRALVKMRFGTDTSAGAPPPVCRLFAYGGHMFDNIPVSITNFQLKLDESVDYFTISSPALKSIFSANTVPMMNAITLSMIPMYSRQEMMKSGVTDWLKGDARKTGGYV